MSAVILAVSVNNAPVYVVSMQMRNMTLICTCELCMCEIYLCWWSCRCYLLNVLFCTTASLQSYRNLNDATCGCC